MELGNHLLRSCFELEDLFSSYDFVNFIFFSAKKKHYLQALSHLLHYVPRQVLLSELPPLMPLMVQSLTQDDSTLYLSTLESLHSLTGDAPDIVSQHIDSLLPSVLRLTGYEPNMVSINSWA